MKYKLLKELPFKKPGELATKYVHNLGEHITPMLFSKDNETELFPSATFSDWFEEVDERWKPEMGTTYFYVSAAGYVFTDRWYAMPYELEIYKHGNRFRTRELAEKAAEQIKALLKEFHKNNP